MKYIYYLLILCVLISPSVSHAQTVPTNEELLVKIQELMTTVLSLMEKLKAVETKQAEIVTSVGAVQQQVASTPVPSTVYILNPNTPSQSIQASTTVSVLSEETLISQKIGQIKNYNSNGDSWSLIFYMIESTRRNDNQGLVQRALQGEPQSNYPNIICVGKRGSTDGGGYWTGPISQSARSQDPILDKACKQLGY